MKLPSFISPLLLLAVLGLIASPSHLNAQTVTWGATGLPPGMTISSVNSSNGVISGTPTTPGSYKAIVYPVVGNIAGDMTTVSINVLPAGVVLPPTYYGYSRSASNGSAISALAGGSGYILVNSAAGPLFTTNGIQFSAQSFPANFGGVGGLDWLQGAISGSRCLISSWNSLAYSDKQGLFSSIGLPSGFSGYPAIQGIGTNFFLIYNPNQNQGVSTVNLQIYSMPNNQTNWTSRAVFTISNFDLKPSMANNGSNIILALSSTSPYPPLFYSANGGTSWTSNSNPGISSVAYGNSMFIGTGASGGIWKSSNGISWSQISSDSVGNIIYSPSLASGYKSNSINWLFS